MRISDSIPALKAQPFVLSHTTKPDSIMPFNPEAEWPSDAFIRSIPPTGTTNPLVLANAPSPDVVIAGQKKKAGIVVDITTNVLYTYDPDGNPTKAYLVASGAKGSPTEKGVRIVTHTETYPYKNAYGTKRKRNPKDYGPFVIVLEKINPKTGELSKTGEFIHGCRSYEETFETDPKRYVSHGCVRMENSAITEVKEVKKGTIVVIK